MEDVLLAHTPILWRLATTSACGILDTRVLLYCTYTQSYCGHTSFAVLLGAYASVGILAVMLWCHNSILPHG